MRLWRVRVKCFQEPDVRGLRPMCYEDCIVEADSSTDALDVGRDFIEKNAPSDVRWSEFLATSANGITLPLHI